MLEHLDLLGPAALDDAARCAAVGRLLGSPVHALEGSVEEVAYDVPSITTVGRWWVRGTATTEAGPRPFEVFVKAVQPWSRSPFFAYIPEEQRAMAAASYPWATEPAVYRSDLSSALPAGLGMPRAGTVVELDGPLAVMWLEVVATAERTWDEARYARAAHLLGRLAASPGTRDLARLGDFPMSATSYVATRLAHQVVPILHSPIWDHPGLSAFAPLREPLLARLPELDAISAEIDALPRLAGHGDACPNNLLADPADPDGFVLIDFGMWNAWPVTTDLSQLLVGDVQVGRRRAGDLGGLAALGEVLLASYADGLAAEGVHVDPATLRRAHALHLFLFAGLSSLPFELLEAPPEVVAAVAGDRAEVTRVSLDLLTATS